MNDQVDLDRLLTGINDFLARGRCASSDVVVGGSVDPASTYWHTTPRITKREIDMLRRLERGPLPLGVIASLLGRTSESARELLDALAAIGVVERAAGGYRNSAATNRYLQALPQRPGQKRPTPGWW